MMTSAVQSSTVIDKWLSTIDRVGKSIVLLSALLVISFCLWSLDRGLEITDEAYYLLLGMHPDAVKLYISAQQWVTGPLWQVTGSLMSFRAAGMVLLMASAALLAIGATSALRQTPLPSADDLGGRSRVIAASLVGALLYAATINLSPCYNLLASAGAYAAAGLLLLSLRTDDRWRRTGLLLLVGIALAVEFVSKPSSGVATLCLLAFWLLVAGQSLPRKMIGLASVLAGFACGAFALAVTQTTIADARLALSQGMELFRMVQVEPVGARLTRYLVEFCRHSIDAVEAFTVVVLAVSLYLLTRRLIFAGLAILSLLYTLVSGRYLLGGVDQYVLQMQAAFVLFLLGLLVALPVCKADRRTGAIVAGLALLPYTVAVGTGNAIFTQVIVSLAPWGVALALLAAGDFPRKADKVLAMTLCAAFVATVAAQIISSGFRAPYHLQAPLIAQSQAVTVGELGSVRVDPETANFVSKLQLAAGTCGIVSGAPFLGLYNIPGVALVLETVPLSTPWLNNVAQADAVLTRAPPGILGSSVVALLLNADGSRPELPAALESFPAGFEYCGEATYPFGSQRIQIWSSRAS